MTREEAINHIWHLTYQVMGEFCCGNDEDEALRQETTAAIKALST